MTDEAMKPEVPDPKPPSDGERKKLVLSLRMRDLTHQQSSKVFAIIGAPPPSSGGLPITFGTRSSDSVTNVGQRKPLNDVGPGSRTVP